VNGFPPVQRRCLHDYVVVARIGREVGIIVDRRLVGHVTGRKTRHAIRGTDTPIPGREKLGRDVSVEPHESVEALAAALAEFRRFAKR
jgi:hypothetical protein